MIIRPIIVWLQLLLMSNATLNRADEGQGLVEYALILVFVAVMIVIVLVMLAPSLSDIYSNILTELEL